MTKSATVDLVAAVAHLRDTDARLRRFIDSVGPCEFSPRKTAGVFDALAEAIVYQQLSTKAAATIHGRVCALFPKGRLAPEPLLAASDQALRGAGLSQAKMLSLQDLARRVLAGEVPTLAKARRMDDAALISALSQVRGVGRWTAEMFLIFHLGRPDVLPADDYGVRRGFAAVFRKREVPSRQAVDAYGARWAPYRTIASWYLWRAADQATGS